MKWLKRLTFLFVALLAIVTLFVAWMLQSESGARFALERAKATLADKLSIGHALGTLASPLELADLRYRDPAAGVDVSIKRIKVDYALSGLLSRTLHVRAIDVDGVDVILTTAAPAAAAAPSPSMQALLTPPLAILLDRARISHIAITHDGKPVFAADSLDLAATWTGTALTIQRLALRAPDGRIDLEGALTSYTDYRGHAKVDFDWRTSQQRVAGTANIDDDGKQATLALNLSQPTAATGDATILATVDTLPWTANLNVPRFDPRAVTGSDALRGLALQLKGNGDRTRGVLSGNIDLGNADQSLHRVLLDSLQFAVSGQTLILQNLHLRSPEASGALSASGKLQLDAKPPGGEMDVNWEGVELPRDLVGQALATHGTLHAGGSAEKFAAHGQFALGPPGKLASIAFELDGTAQKISLHRLDLKQPGGGLNVSGDLVLQPQFGWNLKAQADRLNPGAFAADWPGAISFALSTSGQMENDGPAGRFKLDQLGGKLRQRPLSGNADLTFAPPWTINGTLDLASGKSSIALRGKGGTQTDVNADLVIASLADWLPRTAGAVRGHVTLHGAWPRLDARGRLDGSKIALGEVNGETLAINLDVHDLSAPSGTVTIDAGTLSAAGYLFDTLKLDAHGNESAHTVSLDAHGPKLGIAFALNGALTHLVKGGDMWHGTLSALKFTPKDAPPWQLAHAAELKYTNGDVALGELCLGAQDASVCAAATHTADGAAEARFSVAHLALATIARFASPDGVLKLDGEINGNGDIARAADGALNGNATLTSAAGSIAYPDAAAQPLIAYRNFKLAASFAPQHSGIQVHGDLNDGGRLDGHIAFGANTDSGMPLSGDVEATLNNLGFVDLLSEQTAATRGKLDVHFAVFGSSAAPNVAGKLTLTDLASEVPAAGLKLHDGRITLQSQDGRSFALSGSIGSGDGKLALEGDIGVAVDAPIALKISGADFLAADVPGARVHISPDLMLARAAGKYTLTGTVAIPQADIDVSALPGGGAATVSPDVVVTDAASAPAATGTHQAPIFADITVKLGTGEQRNLDLRQGREVHLVGFGLDGYLSGQLALQDRPGRVTIGRGQVVVDGTYKAYGQDLKIESGRLLFAGTPIDNPGMDLRATRSFTNPDVSVGLQVRGTAQVPVLTVFSTPAMEQSNALSYLVAGKPLSQLKSGEGDAVGSAARALGTAGGGLLAKSIGSKMGLDDIGVSDSGAVGGAALTVGKYLSPRLYLSYGVGLFTPGEVVTLRYRLTRLFNLEVQNGTLSSRAGINYKIEK